MGCLDRENRRRRIDTAPEHDGLSERDAPPGLDDLPRLVDVPGRLLVDWDYVLILEWWDGEAYREGPDPRSLIPAPMMESLRRWSTAMEIEYADETGEHRPIPEAADALDAEFDRLIALLRATGLAVDQGQKWWRAP